MKTFWCRNMKTFWCRNMKTFWCRILNDEDILMHKYVKKIFCTEILNRFWWMRNVNACYAIFSNEHDYSKLSQKKSIQVVININYETFWRRKIKQWSLWHSVYFRQGFSI
jgi:hypothetical protein